MEQATKPGHVLVISHDVVGGQMAGPGIRYYHLARVLAREFPVALAAPAMSDAALSEGFPIHVYSSLQDSTLHGLMQRARAILLPALSLVAIPALLRSTVPLVIDGYDPFLAETLFFMGDAQEQVSVLTQAYVHGDFFICASERQRDWWLGVLEANGRINSHTYQEDPSLRRLVDVVPFGLPEASPTHTQQTIKGIWSGIEETDYILLWGGGLWPWLDPFTAIRAVASVWQRRQDVKLVFPGTRHPNHAMSEVHTHTEAARQLAAQLGLLDKAVFFGDWIPYAHWPSVLLESDIALTLHHGETLESRLAFRSRVLDYIWAGLPTVATRGDATSELIAEFQVGALVENDDVEGVARAICLLLDTPKERFRGQFERARLSLTWERAAQPLMEFCRHPRRAPDKVALGNRLGNPFYIAEISRLQGLVQRYEQRPVAQLMTRLQSLGRRAGRFHKAR